MKKIHIFQRKPGESVSPAPKTGTFSVTLELPPSTNALYQRRRGGQIALSKLAHKYREGVKRLVSTNLARLCQFPIDDETIYRIKITLYFEQLENPGWFQFWEKDTYITRGKHKGELKGRKGERKAKTRYKIIDCDNRVKFLQDCLVNAIGIPNDCQIFHGEQEKRQSDVPGVEVSIHVENRDDYFPEKS